MKFFSLFTKTPVHQRFQYNPRYFDPKKEEMKEREERIMRELSTDVDADPGISDHGLLIPFRQPVSDPNRPVGAKVQIYFDLEFFYIWLF
ncbi:MAG: hypothetical protein HC811_06980 [Flammeovirgaceae bacterium]|nr:hypothetical protein [Flammeovirgaceae bacterium]